MAKEEEEQKPKTQQHMEKKAAGSIIRIAGRDINGDYDILSSLMQIKGIGYNMANALTISIKRMYGIEKTTTLGSLDDASLAKIEGLLKDVKKANIPLYLLNRRADKETGEDMHVIATDLIVKTRQDIENDIKMQTWRGFRHRYGQKVRGQKTRSTGRTGVTVGVMKKTVEAAAKAAEKPKGGAGAPPGGGAAAAAPAAAPGAAPKAAPAAEKK